MNKKHFVPTQRITQQKRYRVYYSAYGHLLSKERLYKGFKKVWKAKGAAGIDKQSLSDFASKLSDELDQLLLELKTKPGTTGEQYSQDNPSGRNIVHVNSAWLQL